MLTDHKEYYCPIPQLSFLSVTLFLDIIDKGVFVGMPLIFTVFFLFFYFPLIIRGKKGISMSGRILDFCQAEPISFPNGLFIHAGSSNHIDVFVLTAVQ